MIVSDNCIMHLLPGPTRYVVCYKILPREGFRGFYIYIYLLGLRSKTCIEVWDVFDICKQAPTEGGGGSSSVRHRLGRGLGWLNSSEVPCVGPCGALLGRTLRGSGIR